MIVAKPKEEEPVELPVKFEVYSSLVCPACAQFFPTVYNLYMEYEEDPNVEVIYYHTNETGDAYNGFVALMAAERQDKKWE